MIRDALNYLNNWLKSDNRKPIILRGARQVGKTHTVRELAKITNRQLIEVNFEKHIDIQSIFKSNDPKTILTNLSAYFSVDIDIKQNILFLDEIQAAPEILAKLRWFAEDLPELAVIAAGSLLDFILDDHNFSMPVGRITYLYMNPLSFEEYLAALEKKQLLKWLHDYQLNIPLAETIHQQLTELFKEYTLIGGMPAAVYTWKHSHSFTEVHRVHLDLLSSYRDDFAKYANQASIARLDEVLLAIPKMLGRKFMFSHINKEVKSTALKQALNLLAKARVCNQVFTTAANGVPILSEINNKNFKVNLLDVGLACSQLGLAMHQLHQAKDLTLVNSGAIAEQVVGQLLLTTDPFYVDPPLCYWARENRNSNAEIDYIIQFANDIVPIEVKAGESGSLKSLHLFMQEKSAPIAVRINMAPPQLQTVTAKTHNDSVSYRLLSIPMYLTGQIKRLLKNELL